LRGEQDPRADHRDACHVAGPLEARLLLELRVFVEVEEALEGEDRQHEHGRQQVDCSNRDPKEDVEVDSARVQTACLLLGG